MCAKAGRTAVNVALVADDSAEEHADDDAKDKFGIETHRTIDYAPESRDVKAEQT